MEPSSKPPFMTLPVPQVGVEDEAEVKVEVEIGVETEVEEAEVGRAGAQLLLDSKSALKVINGQ